MLRKSSFETVSEHAVDTNLQKLTLTWESDRSMRALFSNRNSQDKNAFRLLMVFHKSKKGGFEREISVGECNKILKKVNPSFCLEFD